jgi:hypothetical protein
MALGRSYIRSPKGSRRVRCVEMAWLRADDVFAAADAEADALNPDPWLQRREGPMRKPDEGRIQARLRRPDLENRLRGLAMKIQETICALDKAGPADAPPLRRQFAAFRAHATKLQGRRRAS